VGDVVPTAGPEVHRPSATRATSHRQPSNSFARDIRPGDEREARERAAISPPVDAHTPYDQERLLFENLQRATFARPARSRARRPSVHPDQAAAGPRGSFGRQARDKLSVLRGRLELQLFQRRIVWHGWSPRGVIAAIAEETDAIRGIRAGQDFSCCREDVAGRDSVCVAEASAEGPLTLAMSGAHRAVA
jgi:hypothetical protein